MKAFAILACLCLTFLALPTQADDASSCNLTPMELQDLLQQRNAQGMTREVVDPRNGAVYKAIDSGICCSSSSACPTVSGYIKRCSSGSCTSKSTCLYS